MININMLLNYQIRKNKPSTTECTVIVPYKEADCLTQIP